jgi:glycosyltransferase involved in cell wall biosynthesis
MKSLWIFNHYAVSPDLPGGTRHFDLAKELVKRGWQVVIFASSFRHYIYKDFKLSPGKHWKLEDMEGVKFLWLRTLPYQRNDWHRVLNMISYMLRAWRLGRKLPRLIPEVQRPDVVIGSSVHLLAVLAAYRVAKLYKARFIMEVRDLWPQTIIDMGELSERSPLTQLIRTLERFLYRRAERIITLLPKAGEYIVAQGICEEKIIWIPNGVDLSRFQIRVRSKSEGSFQVMYLGAHGQANALDVLLQAAKIIQDEGYRNVKFVLIGDGPEKPHLMQMAEALQLRNVEFRASVQRTEVPRVLNSADAVALILNDLPLYRYGISLNKLYDYMAAGKPVLLAGNPANNPVEEAKCGIIVPPQNPQALADAIIRLYTTSPEEREVIGQRGREYVKEHYDIRRLVERLERTLKEVLEESSSE